jgi:hypothetical protein
VLFAAKLVAVNIGVCRSTEPLSDLQGSDLQGSLFTAWHAVAPSYPGCERAPASRAVPQKLGSKGVYRLAYTDRSDFVISGRGERIGRDVAGAQQPDPQLTRECLTTSRSLTVAEQAPCRAGRREGLLSLIMEP